MNYDANIEPPQMTLRKLRAALDAIPAHLGDCRVRVYCSLGMAMVHKDIDGVTVDHREDYDAEDVIIIQAD